VSPQNPQTGVEVFVGSPAASDLEQMETDDSMTGASATDAINYKGVDLEGFEGKNLLNKMEILMAVLTDCY